MNPLATVVTRDDLKNPAWADDTGLGDGVKEFIDDDEVRRHRHAAASRVSLECS